MHRLRHLRQGAAAGGFPCLRAPDATEKGARKFSPRSGGGRGGRRSPGGAAARLGLLTPRQPARGWGGARSGPRVQMQDSPGTGVCEAG